jgi:hypothetical protein
MYRCRPHVETSQLSARRSNRQENSLPSSPKDHVIAIAFARVFGPRNATTPEGHPIVISSGPFDLTVETPQHAIARAARRWFGIEVHEPHWEIEMAEDVIIAADHPMAGMVPWSKFFHLRYTPEATKWNERGLHAATCPTTLAPIPPLSMTGRSLQVSREGCLGNRHPSTLQDRKDHPDGSCNQHCYRFGISHD